MSTTVTKTIEVVPATDPSLSVLVGPSAVEWHIVAWAITHDPSAVPPFAVSPISLAGETGAVRDARTGRIYAPDLGWFDSVALYQAALQARKVEVRP